MKKIIAITLAVLTFVMALSFAGCGKNESNKQKLIVGFDAEFPPFGYIKEDGSYDGFDLAMAKEVCKRLDWDFEAVAIEWESKDKELESGNITCIWNGFTYTGRESEYTWSDPYYNNQIILVVRADSGIKSMKDLAGKVVMAQKESSAVEGVKDNKEFSESLKDVVELADYNQGFLELKQKTVDAVAADLGVARANMANYGDEFVILEGEENIVSTEQYAVGFLKGNTEIRDQVNAELLKMAADGTMDTIAANYTDPSIGLVADYLCLGK